MKLFVLVPNQNREKESESPDPWDPWYDKCFKMVIRAENEKKARIKAQGNSGAETTLSPVHHDVEERIRDREVWTDHNLVSCIPIDEYETDNDVICQFVRHA